MWTGVYPHAHGVVDNVYGIDDAIASHSKVKTTVIDMVHRAGYRTAHFGKWHLGEGKPQGFDVWESSFNSRQGHWIDGLQDGTYRPDQQTDACLAFLRAQTDPDQPFLMVQSYYPPHDPYTAPKHFYDPYRGKGIPFAGYYAAVTALDACTGRILDTLEQTHLKKRTIVLYFTDHGDTFLYRREGEHKFVCFDDAIRIPLLASGPGVTEGAVRTEPVGLQDLVPTILDYAGVPASTTLHGASLRPLLEGRSVPWRDEYYVQNITHVSAMSSAVSATERWKLIASVRGDPQFFDLQADPEEELDVYLTPRPDPGFERYKHISDHALAIDAMAQRMLREAQRMGDELGAVLANRVRDDIAPRLSGAALPGG